MKDSGNRQIDRQKRPWATHEFPVPATHLTPEQILTWLEGWREFQFEVWKKNPDLRDNYLKLEKKVRSD